MEATEKRRRILVVDDEPQNIKMMREILKSDYTVMAATSGAQKIATTKSAAMRTFPSPVRAPAATPAALSM